MQIYGYQNQEFTGHLIPIHIRESITEFNTLGLSQSKAKHLRLGLEPFFSLVPRATIQLPANGDPMHLLFAVIVALHALEKQLLTLCPHRVLIYGQVDLEGTIAPSPSLRDIPHLCRQQGIDLVLTNLSDTSLASEDTPQIHISKTIDQALAHLYRFALQHQGHLASAPQAEASSLHERDPFRGILGLERAKEALIYASAGNLPFLFYGPPGAGKTLLLSRLQLLLPPLEGNVQQEVYALHNRTLQRPPSLSISSTMQQQDLVSGKIPWICKAHGGALLADELATLKPKVRTSLASLLDTHAIGSYPLSFLLGCATNACTCSNLGSRDVPCLCSEQKIDRFWANLGHPLLDRLAICTSVEPENLLVSKLQHTSYDFGRIAEVRKILNQRTDAQLIKLLPLHTRLSRYREGSMRRALLCCKLAQTIADYQGKTMVTQELMEQANSLYLLPRDRHYQ
ncbi:MAG: ATP-binding protein [Spirochaetales bacterium]|nr:ATP-binding protein [Spirochaetales bacterium]